MKESKIGIITFHRALNYGAVLQTYALYKTVKGLGSNCEIVDYRNDRIEFRRKYIRYEKKAKIKSIVHSLLTLKQQKRKRNLFQNFVDKYFSLSIRVNSHNISEIKNQYTAFITGSDQVFSPVCVDFDSAYFLNFARPEQKFSYSASFGTNNISEIYQDEIKKRLENFKKISVREESGRKIVNDIVHKEAEVNIDPSLLLDASEWEQIEGKLSIKDKYIFMFRVNKPNHMFEFAKKLACEKKLKVIYVSDSIIKREKEFEYIDIPTVEEFISYIHHAEYVITNSFHATAFSIIFNKNVYVELQTQTGRNTRAEELLNMLHIKNRDISEYIQDKDFIDWDTANSILDRERDKAKSYLKEIVENSQR